MLTLTNLTYRIQGRELFEDASLVLPAGSKTGFVGKNGTGKTTLFHLIQGHMGPDAGKIELVRKARIGAVAQEAPAGDETVLDVVLAADKERTALMAEAETATDPDRIGEIYIRLADIDAHTAEARASSILKGLGFEQDRQLAPTRELSGGWRMRVALAAVLFSQPDLLLLDEPTNYLDLEGTLWLEKYLATYPYTVFMISHDRDLLNKAVTSIVHLEHRKLSFYKGNYDTFEATRRMQMELNNKTRDKTLDQIAHLQKFVDRFKAKATKAKQAQARVKMIEKLKPPAAMFDEHSAPFRFQQPKAEMPTPMVTLDGVSTGYGDKVILRNINMRIDPEDRIALVGVNGNGKSTFAKLLARDIPAMGGTLRIGKKLEIAHFAQHQMDKLKPEWTPLEHMAELMPTDNETKRRSRLNQMGLTTSRMDTKAKNLSGGERARLLMGLITFHGPGMMILDEPTNHLDIDSRDALAPLLHTGGPVGEIGAFWTAHALADVLEQAAGRAPLLVVLDDLHRTDGLTLELLRLTADRLAALPVLVIGTYRPSEAGAELGQARAALANLTAAHILLDGLDDAALTQLATDSGLVAVTPETLRLLRERTGGNPLFARELVRLMVAEGIDAAHGGVPAGVGDVVRRRLARLPPQTATALRQAAVLGREVDITLLGELARSDGDALLDALEPAVLTGLVEESAPDRIRFAHNLIRDTLYDDMSVLRRSRLHAAALRMLRGRSADAASLAYHAVAAATADTAMEAADFAMNAAAEADTVGAPAEAARQWRSAVQMFELAGADQATATAARCGLIAALAQAGDALGSREELHRTMAAIGHDDALAVRALTASTSPLVWRVRAGDQIDPVIIGPLRRVLDRERRTPTRIRLLLTLFTELEGVEHEAALAASTEALKLVRGIDDRRLLLAVLNVRAFACLGPDLAQERENVLAEMLSVAEELDAVDYQAVAHWFAFLDASGRSDLARAAAHVDQAVARAGTGQLGFLLGVLDAFGAQLAVLAGHTDEGERGYVAVSAKLAEYGVANGAHIGIVGRVSANLVRGSLAPMADELVAVHRHVSRMIADGAVIALHQAGRPDEAAQIWTERIPNERSFYFVAMATLRAHAAVLVGDLDAAVRTAEELRPYSGRFAGLDNGTLLTGPVDDALAAVAEATGDDRRAADYRRAAAELTDRLRAAAQALLD